MCVHLRCVLSALRALGRPFTLDLVREFGRQLLQAVACAWPRVLRVATHPRARI